MSCRPPIGFRPHTCEEVDLALASWETKVKGQRVVVDVIIEKGRGVRVCV